MPAASSPNGSMIEGVTTSASRPKQQSGLVAEPGAALTLGRERVKGIARVPVRASKLAAAEP